MNETRTLQGKVISDRMDKTVVVLVERRVRHPIYGKFMTRTTKLHIHDEKNIAVVGDIVTFKGYRPISKTKSWVLVDVIAKN